MQTVRVGLIGCGHISHRHMCIYRNMNDNAEKLGFRCVIACVAEVIPERLKAWAEQYGIAEEDCYTDFHKMLERDDIDTIDVCVHTNYHVPVAIECMKAGYDVYCEKPAASSYADCKLMIDAAEKLGRKFHVQMSSIMTAQSRMAKEIVQSGKLGQVYMTNLEVNLQRRRPGYDLPDFSQGFLSKYVAGHGQSVDLGVYLIGQLMYIFDCPKVQSVTGFAGHFVEWDPSRVSIEGGFDVDDTIDGFVKFENGMGFHYTNMSACNCAMGIRTNILGSHSGIELLFTDTNGGKYARQKPTDPPGFGTEPDIILYEGQPEGMCVETRLDCDVVGMKALEEDPNLIYYNDNQCMWIAYKLGIIDDAHRPQTPQYALNQLIITDGMFLSQEWGRSVTYDEIIANSPCNYVKEQIIDGKLYTYDIEI